MSPKRDLSGFAAPGGLPEPPPPPASAPANGGAPWPQNTPSPAPPIANRRTARPNSADRTAAPTVPRTAPETTADAAPVVAPKGRPGRRRICVSLTLETYEQLAELADARDCWKVELVVEALGRWETLLKTRLAGSTPGRFRRRRSSTPTPYVMDLTPDELARLDGLAKEIGRAHV